MKIDKMIVQKYKALIKGTDTEIIGYLAEISNNEIVMFVSEFSMPNSIQRGTFIVEKDSIEKVGDATI